MDLLLKFLLIYLIVINIISMIITAYDKRSAIKGRLRIKESTLMLFSALGGSVAMFITMQIIRHKTRHMKFMLGIPFIFIIQCILAFLLWRYIYG